jgi:hypothetical protein|eukprot:SAG25_NODE_44_length_19254_cov_246.998121_7_plen_64_part_00
MHRVGMWGNLSLFDHGVINLACVTWPCSSPRILLICSNSTRSTSPSPSYGDAGGDHEMDHNQN